MADPRAITIGLLSWIQRSKFLGRDVLAMTFTPECKIDESTMRIPVTTVAGSGVIKIQCPDLNTIRISAKLGLTKRQRTFELSEKEMRFKEKDPWPNYVLDDIKRWLEK